MKKKVQAIIKNPLSGVDSARIYPDRIIRMLFLRDPHPRRRTSSKSFFIFSVIVLLLEIAVLVGMTYLAKKRPIQAWIRCWQN